MPGRRCENELETLRNVFGKSAGPGDGLIPGLGEVGEGSCL